MAATKCPKCDGCGKIASHNKEPWTQFAGHPYHSEKLAPVRNGETEPLPCKDCGGSGEVKEKEAAAKEAKK